MKHRWSRVFALLLIALSVIAQRPASRTPTATRSPSSRSLLVGVYPTTDGAEKAYKDLRELERNQSITVDAFSILVKDDKGNIQVRDTAQSRAGWGAVAGGVIGAMIFWPVGVAGAALATAGAGGLVGWLSGRAGIPQKDIQTISEALTPNSSAIVAVVDNRWVASFENVMRRQRIKTFINDQLQNPEAEETAH